MLKRILSTILAIALLVAAVPESVYATSASKGAGSENTANSGSKKKTLYGDVNDDGEIDLLDILVLKRYIAEENPSGFTFKNADVNVDKAVDLADLLMLNKYFAEWDIALGAEQLPVNFYDGDRLIETLYATAGEAVGTTPSVEKTSKSGGIFEGWYQDPECTTPFYAADPVTEDTDVYAKYEDVPGMEETLTIDSYAKTDVGSDYTITIKGSGDVNAAASLIPKDGTEAPELDVKDNGDGTYTVSAVGGFREGSSYELELAEGFNFVGDSGELPETVRTAAITIKKAAVDKMELNDDIIYIADTEDMKYSKVDGDKDGECDDTVDEITGNMSFSSEGSKASNVDNAASLKAGDIICFYVGTNPRSRNYKESAYVGEPEVYVKVKSVSGSTVYFTSLSEEDMNDVYDVPDVFPLKGTAADNKIHISNLDTSVYALYGIDTPTLAYAKEQIAAGDFVAIFTETPEDEEDITFGKITAYDETNGEITFAVCNAEDIIASRDMYVQPSISGDDLVSEETKEEIESIMTAQIEESGFAEEAAYVLATLSTKTDGFKNMDNLREVLLSDESGEPLTAEEIELLNIGASFELQEGVKLSVELITNGEELHFDDGVQLAVGIEAQFEVEAEEGKVVIDLNATFIEELEIKPVVDGSLTYKKILGIPIPNGVRVTANVDVKNYTAYDFDVTAYTVGAEDESTWKKLKELAKNPAEITEMLSDSGLIPDKYAGQLKKVGDVFEKIEEVEKKISDAKAKYNETEEQIESYTEDLESLWNLVEGMHEKDTEGELFTKETWAQAARDLSKTNIAQELLHLTEDGITDGDAGVDNDVSIKSVEELMERYSEMLQKDTDWVTLLEQKITEAGAGIKCINIMIKVDFIIRANMSIALGSTLEYEMGKRYTFWFKVGLYKPSSGSSNMDIIDESLVFQFYVMGKLEIKMGAKITLGVNLGSSDVAYVGIYAEVGPYVKLYGFFVYTYEQLRTANALEPISHDRKMGALYLETGIYLIVGAEASAIKGLFEASYDFVDEEFPILNAGQEEFPYKFAYAPQEGEMVYIKDSDGNSANGVTMVLPDSFRSVTTMTLTNGVSANKIYDYEDYYITLSNPNFSLDADAGIVSVTVPEGERYMECELRLTYKYGKMAFSDYDIGVIIPLCWTNYSTDELSEFYNVSVRVGNSTDGYEIVWTQRVRKNTEFILPTEAEVKELIGYNQLKYISGDYAEDYDTSTGVIRDTVYDFEVAYKTYSVTVTGIQGTNNAAQTFTAKFGEAFDFSRLEGTGTNSGETYTIFRNVTTDETIDVGTEADGTPITEQLDLTQSVSGRMADALGTGNVHAVANYVDNSVTTTFHIDGIDVEDQVQIFKKGTMADIMKIEQLVADHGLAIKDITPAVDKPVYANTVYVVTVGEMTGEKYTITLEENGGASVEDITKVGGSLLGTLPTSVKTGYTFGGWYTDSEFANAFTAKLMPKENMTLYAKWTANDYTVSFHVNGGTSDTPADKTITYDGTYGELPTASKTGYGFIGWFTAAEGGEQITADTKVSITGAQTVYAQWRELKVIDESVFSFGSFTTNPVYEKNTEVDMTNKIIFTPETGEAYQLSEFTIEYKVETGTEYVTTPKDAGTYLARITRPADDYYDKFEAVYDQVLTIDKATRVVPEGGYEIAYEVKDGATQLGYTYFDLETVGDSIDDLDENASFVYTTNGEFSENGAFERLNPTQVYTVTINITGDSNYHDVTNAKTYMTVGGTRTENVSMKAMPTENWSAHTEEVDISGTEIAISTPGQLAYIAQVVNGGNNLNGKTIGLLNDIDLSGYLWTQIGTSKNPFFGNFNGCGYTITGLVINAPDQHHQGLFGKVGNWIGMSAMSILANVAIDDSYVAGSGGVGSLVGSATFSVVTNCISYGVISGQGSDCVGGIVGVGDKTVISNCVFGGKVTNTGEDTGGIIGYSGGNVTNCINAGEVTGSGNHTGGVVGYNYEGKVLNCANRGDVTGNNCVGGIVGENSESSYCEVYNCYTSGQIQGNGTYVGAVVGRNQKNKGSVDQGYYLYESCKDGSDYRNALGTEDGSLSDGDKNKCAFFQITGSTTASQTTLARQCEDGASPNTLLNALVHWVDRCNGDDSTYVQWAEDSDGYPTLQYTGLPKSALDIR